MRVGIEEDKRLCVGLGQEGDEGETQERVG